MQLDAMRSHEYADLFPLLEGPDFDALVADIRANGQLQPIWLYEGCILDGRNRYRACVQAGVAPRFETYTGTDPLGFVLSLNLRRRQLTESQLAILALKIEAVEAKRAAARQAATQFGSTVVANVPPPDDAGKARDIAAAAVGVSPRQVQKAKAVNKSRPDLAEKVRIGSITLHAAERQMKEDEHKENLERPIAVSLPQGVFRGDFRELSESIESDSVDLIFTDPPYDEDSAALYADAARIAARVLKPGGSLIAYSGQRHLPEVLIGMREHLRYWWTCAAVHEGGNQILQKLGIRCGWKPLVWFVKEYRGDVQNVLVDVVRGDREKFAHEWQQAESEARYFIQKLCSADGVVVDFFLGGGTTAVAAKALGRRFIGFEVDAAAIERSAKRMAV